MAQSDRHPKLVPCPSCSATVKREDTEVNIKVKGGKIKITKVPQYECNCGMLFIPHETQTLISDIQKDRRLKIDNDINVSYQDLLKNGKRILKS